MPARPKRAATEKAPNYSDLIASLPEEGEVERDEDEDGSAIMVKPDTSLPSTSPPHQSQSPTPKRTPKRERSPESPVEEDDGGQYRPEQDVKTPIKARKTSAQSSPSKAKTVASPKKGGKFESTPENRQAILAEILKQVSTSKIDWKAVSEATGDDSGKLSKYYGQTFRKHLEAAVLSTSFGQKL